MNKRLCLPYVYVVTHSHTKEFYIGVRWANKVPAIEDLGTYYFTSSKNVAPRFNEFNTKILAEFFDKDTAFEYEQQLIKEEWNSPLCLNKNYKNKKSTKFKCTGHTLRSRLKMSESMKGRIPWNKGKKNILSAEHGLIKHSKQKRGIPLSDEVKQKISKSLKGRKKPQVSSSTRKKQSLAKKKSYEKRKVEIRKNAISQLSQYLQTYHKPPTRRHWRAIYKEFNWYEPDVITRCFGAWKTFSNLDNV